MSRSRLLVGNFDLEHTLASGGRAPPPALRRIVAELAPMWIAAAHDGDVLWCPEPIDPAFFENLHAAGLPHIRAVSRHTDIPAGPELVPWGWTDDVIRWGDAVAALIDAPPLEAVRAVNSRRFSHQLECDLGVGLKGAAVTDTLSGLFEAIDRLPHPEAGWVVKSEFSSASRERFLHRGDEPNSMGARVRSAAHGPAELHVPAIDVPGLPVGQTRPPQPYDRDALCRWARRRLGSGQALFVEPWVDRVDEVGVQLTVPRNGEPRVEGVTRLLVDAAGHYRGSEFSPLVDADVHWHDAVTIALDVARAVQQAGYFGPLGIDAMRYRDPAGDMRLRPLQDINARWTMGRLSLGLRRLLRRDERGYWLHGPRWNDAATETGQAGMDADDFGAHVSLRQDVRSTAQVREIATSPEDIGGQPVRLCSVVRLVDPP